MTPRLYLEVAGCRLNACEAEEIQRRAVGLGASIAACPEEADVSLLYTCAVTSRSQARCRRAARTLLRRTNGRVVAAGCSARLFPADFLGCPERLQLASTPAEAVLKILGADTGIPEDGPFEARSFRGSRTRALLKIQDGCDNRCSFCIVPRSRGPSRSIGAGSVAAQARELASEGFREIVLTGVDIASWGRDLRSGGDLPDLVAMLLDEVPARIRIGSIEPMNITRDFLRRLSRPGVCRHLHVPFQSGSSAVLKAMGRSGDPRRILDWISEFFPGAGIGTDLIAGFPGETGVQFGETEALASDGRLAYIHVFPFCARPGTPAACMPAGPPEGEKTGRAVILRRLSEERRMQFRSASIGTSASALVEDRIFHGSRVALTDNYIPLQAPDGAREGEELLMVIKRENVLWGLR